MISPKALLRYDGCMVAFTRSLLFVVPFILSVPAGQDGVSIRVAGNAQRIAGRNIEGKAYVPLAELADALGAKLTVSRSGPASDIDILITPNANAKSVFDDTAEAVFEIDGDTSQWKVIPNSNNRMRIRDFVSTKESWTYRGELEVAPNSFLVEGRVPRSTATLSFYCVMKDKDGKTMDRKIVSVEGVSYEGGKYPFTLDARNITEKVPKTVGLRFNSASDPVDR